MRTSLLAVVLLCMTLALTSCGGDDETSVDELLSEETTPITFNLLKGTHFLFDYAGNHLVGADTINIQYSNKESRSVDLRQGKHRLLWMRGLDVANYDTATGIVSKGSHFNPLPQYCFKDIEVTPYLMPAQTLEYQPLCALLQIVIFTDTDDYDISKTTVDFPCIKSVGLEDNRYTIDKNVTLYFGLSNDFDGRNYLYLIEQTLCPKDGLDDIELSCNIGSLTFKLPKISLRRGQVTEIEGSLRGNDIGDFSVSIHQ